MPTFKLFMSDDCNLSVQPLVDIEPEFGVLQWFLQLRITDVCIAVVVTVLCADHGTAAQEELGRCVPQARH